MTPVAYLSAHPRLRRGLWWCASLIIVLAILLTFLPVAAAWYAQGWLRNNGAENAVIEDIDLNLFTGVARVTGLQAGSPPDARLHVGLLQVHVRWWPLISKRIHVEAVRLADAQVDVRAGGDGAWHFGMLSINPAAAGNEPVEVEAVGEDSPAWGFGSELVHLTDVTLTYRDELLDSEVDIHEITLGSHYTWAAGRTTELEVDMTVDGSPLRLSSDVQPWAEDRSIAGSLKLEDLDVNDYRTLLSNLADLNDPSGTFSFDLEMQAAYKADGTLELTISGPLEVDRVGFNLEGMRIDNDRLLWDGEVRIDLPAPADGSLLAVDGALALSGSRVALAEPALRAAMGDFQWQGNVRLSPPVEAGGAYLIDAASTVSAGGIAMHHTELDMQLAALERLAFTELTLNGIEQIGVGQIELQTLSLLKGESEARQADVFQLQSATIEQLAYAADGGVSAAKANLEGPRAAITRNADGTLAGISPVLAAFAAPQSAASPDTDSPSSAAMDVTEIESQDAPAPMPFRIDRVEIRGEQWLSFNDLAVDPPARFDLSTLSLAVDNIDSRGGSPAGIRLETGDDALRIIAAGTVDAFSDALGVALDINVANLNLPPLSPYVPGYNIERGRFSTDSRLKVRGDALDVSNALLVERLQLAGKGAEGSELLAAGMAMPLDVALDLLRDGEDRIKLDLPVSGSLTDPQFGTGDIVRKAMQSALQSAAMTYVKNALQPLGTILLVTDLARKSARPRFAPIEMLPGGAALSQDGLEYLDKIGGLLNERPGLQLTLCGVAAPADRQAMLTAKLEEQSQIPQAQDGADAGESTSAAGAETGAAAPAPPMPTVTEAELLALAQARTTAALNYLTETAGIDRARLFACRASFVESEDQGPQIEISL